MGNAKIQTIPTAVDVVDFVALLENDRQRSESKVLINLMHRVSGKPPMMWGPAIIGFDKYHYRYESGREGDMPRIAFAPRKGKLVLYIINDATKYSSILERLGKHRTSKACIYINKLADVDMKVLEELVEIAYKDTFTA